jgi:hypothetical protein
MLRKVLLALALGALAPIASATPLCAGALQGYTCCKVCKSGKACGDGCIAKDAVCKKPKGCACDG